MKSKEKEVVYISRACPQELFNTLIIQQNIAAAKFNYSIIRTLAKKYVVHSLYVYDKSLKKEDIIIKENYRQYITRKTKHITRAVYLIKRLVKLFKTKDCILIADVLNYSDSLIACVLSKIFSIKSIAVITDFPEYLGGFVPKKERTLMQNFTIKFKYFIFNMFDNYVLLTENMVGKLKISSKDEYIVIEGIGNVEQFSDINSIKKKQIMYAGTLNKEYGIMNLVNAFQEYIKNNNTEYKLVIYGKGNCENQIKEISSNNPEIEYRGCVENDLILQEECSSMLLVNPRPVYAGNEEDEYEKYSFPSKTMEYMSSGTPILTMKLSGMPDEYLPYIYEIKEASVEGIYGMLDKILSQDEATLFEKGKQAQKFIKEHKSADIQVGKIVDHFLE